MVVLAAQPTSSHVLQLEGLLKDIESLPFPITILAAITSLHSPYQQHNFTVSSSLTHHLRLLTSYSSICLSSPRVPTSQPNKATATTTLQTKSRGTPIRELRKLPCLITGPRVLKSLTVSQRCVPQTLHMWQFTKLVCRHAPQSPKGRDRGT